MTDEMTDDEIIRLCAQAIGMSNRYMIQSEYNPLKYRMQAMDLLITFRLAVSPPTTSDGVWGVAGVNGDATGSTLERAICMCVAKMQRDKVRQ